MTRSRRTSTSPLAQWFDSVSDWETAVLPDYLGGANVNLIASVYRAFGIESAAIPAQVLPPVRDEILPYDFLADSRVLLFLVIDGLGQLRFREAIANGMLSGLATFHYATQLTSVFPSTTAAALTSLQTGVSPACHGFTGYTMYVPENQRVYNMITWKPVGESKSETSLRLRLPAPNMYTLLQRHGINTRLVSSAAFRDSPLTNIHASGVQFAGHRTLSEFADLLFRYSQREGRWFVFGYWDGFDLVSHLAGPDSRLADTELRLIDSAFEMALFAPLRDSGADVTVVVTADHGHTAIPLDQRKHLALVDEAVEQQRHRPTGEPRTMGISLPFEPFGKRIQERVADAGVVMNTADAIQAGLYGPGKHHDQLAERIGKTLIVARGNHAFDYQGFNNRSLGGHGSLAAHEMLVPLLVWRFGQGNSSYC